MLWITVDSLLWTTRICPAGLAETPPRWPRGGAAAVAVLNTYNPNTLKNFLGFQKIDLSKKI